MKRAAGTSAALLAALALTAVPAQAAAKAPECPDSVKAPSAIVVEVSTGTVACARQADEERSIANAHQNSSSSPPEAARREAERLREQAWKLG